MSYLDSTEGLFQNVCRKTKAVNSKKKSYANISMQMH